LLHLVGFLYELRPVSQ